MSTRAHGLEPGATGTRERWSNSLWSSWSEEKAPCARRRWRPVLATFPKAVGWSPRGKGRRLLAPPSRLRIAGQEISGEQRRHRANGTVSSWTCQRTGATAVFVVRRTAPLALDSARANRGGLECSDLSPLAGRDAQRLPVGGERRGFRAVEGKMKTGRFLRFHSACHVEASRPSRVPGLCTV